LQVQKGALEALVRVSTLDLDDGIIEGGKFWRITPMVNWYLNKDIRLELVYGYGVLDRFSLEGATQFFQTRIQFTLL
jgi:phosphate-selective porin OprO/OprP